MRQNRDNADLHAELMQAADELAEAVAVMMTDIEDKVSDSAWGEIPTYTWNEATSTLTAYRKAKEMLG